MLSSLRLGDAHNIGTSNGKIALDCSVRSTRQGHVVISTTDFFFPLVDSPYLQGYIGAANVLSDLYAEGVGSCDFVLMLLAACRDMTESDKTICTREMVRGFNDACLHAGTVVTGGQTVINPWPVIGGVATTICSEGEYVRSNGAQVGDVVILTKPLGTQVAVNVHEWRRGNTYQWNAICTQNILSDEQAKDMMHTACCSMATLNRNAGSIMVKHNAHAGTDVTGFGLLGHAQNLMDNQIMEVGMELHTLPCIKNTIAIDTAGIFNFRLVEGYSAETSGGLMICMSEVDAIAYCKELKLLNTNGSIGGDDEDTCCWIIGRIVANSERKASVVANVTIIEV